MNFLKQINWIRHRTQYKKHFDLLMWDSRYRDSHNGKGYDVNKLCRNLHITHYQYECVLAGSPLVTIPVCNEVINYVKSLVLNKN